MTGAFCASSRKAADDVLGDAVVETRFSGRVQAGGRSSCRRTSCRTTADFRCSISRSKQVSFNEPVSVAADAVPPLPDWVAPASLPSEKLGEGVFVIPGRYSAVAVDLGDFMAVIEGPQSEARSLYIIGEAKRLIPGKPIRYVVNTHAHFDHTAGLRTFAAEGATIVTQEGNVGFFKDVLQPATDAASRQSCRGRLGLAVHARGRRLPPSRVRAVRSDFISCTGWITTQNMLIAYLPGPKVLVEADAFTPPAQCPNGAPAEHQSVHGATARQYRAAGPRCRPIDFDSLCR